jgi:hypothetical protein
MGYLILMAELSWQISASPNSRQCHGDCRISNFPDGGEGECLHDKGSTREEGRLRAVLHDRSLAISTRSNMRPISLTFWQVAPSWSRGLDASCLCDSLSGV